MDIQSPLNYTGGKFKLLPQIKPYFPKEAKIFVDLFGGGFNVGANVDYPTIVYNEYDTNVFNIVKGIYDDNKAIERIDSVIKKYSLSKTNRDGFLSLRKEWNESKEKDWVDLYALIVHSFNYSIRFNKKGGFNMTFGKDKSEFNPKLREKFVNFQNLIKDKNIFFYNESFEKLTSSPKINSDYFFYCLPEGSLIYQDGLYRPIEEVIENKTDLGNGNICVKKHVRHTENEELLRFNIMGISRHYDLRVSKDHILFVYDNETKTIIEKKAKDVSLNDNLIITCDERVDNYIPTYERYSNRSFKTLKIDYSKKNELALLLGMFMAEGHRQNGLIFSYHVKETYYHVLTKNLIKEVFGLDALIAERSPHNTVTQVRCLSNELEQYFLNLYNGETARYKKLNDFVMQWDMDMQLNLLKGWLYGDGGLEVNNEVSENVKFIRSGKRNKYKISGTTSSFDLATQMYNIALRCGLHPCWRKRVSKCKKPLKDGRTEVVVYNIYFTMKKDVEKILATKIEGRNCGRRYWVDEKHLVTKINKIETELYSGRMYDLTTLQGNFWTFGNVRVHNCDPPYLITTATYNESDGWGEDSEKLLYEELDKINDKGAKFALSNVIEHKGRTNEILKEWMKKYNVHYLDYNYGNCSYQGKNTDKKTIEVLITNY